MSTPLALSAIEQLPVIEEIRPVKSRYAYSADYYNHETFFRLKDADRSQAARAQACVERGEEAPQALLNLRAVNRTCSDNSDVDPIVTQRGIQRGPLTTDPAEMMHRPR
ncbi:hypothetical protein ACFVJ5_27505 [Nocardia sp. NPDC127606]|uniref:hypothetical protein n=1 Tax=Nocardia sp. NPDC127606 TaxID=3345406 RepID=UPI003633F3A1